MNWVPMRSIVGQRALRQAHRFISACGVTFMGCCAVSLAGCATRESDTVQPSESVGVAAQKIQIPEAPTADTVLVRRAGANYEIELRSPKGFPAGGLPLELKVGDVRLQKSHASRNVGGFGIVFEMSASEYEALPDGSNISIAYVHAPSSNVQSFAAAGNRRGAVGKSFGTLDKSTLQR